MSRPFTYALSSLALAGCISLAGCVAMADEAGVMPAKAQQTVDMLAERGLKDDIGLKFVEDLTTNIGPRLAGSEAEARARDWAVAELTSLGFDNVRIEAFTIPYWSRVKERAYVVGPAAQPLIITALGGSPSTPAGGIEANIVRFTSLKNLSAAPASSVAGKIVFIDEPMTRTQDGSGYGMAVRKRGGCAGVAAEKGAAACLIRSVGTQHHRMPHTGGMSREGPLGALPAAALSPPDADQLTRLLTRGPVKVNLSLTVESAESVPSGNVIAEVTGSSRADEIVLISCHLDSWDLGTGALDDGAGCGIVVGAAKLIDALPGKPERTVRVVLYGSEEIGLFGGKAYAKQHAGELDKHVLAAESDFGAGPVWRFQTRFGDGAMAYREAMLEALAPLGISPGDNMARGGPDVSMLPALGVPVVTPGQDGSDYFDYHHTPDDTFDKIDPEMFRQNVATYAVFAYLAADMGWDFRKADVEGE